MPKPTEPEIQRAYFEQAITLLGGRRALADRLGLGERHVRKLLAGDADLHDGILRDTAAALIAHAEACRQLERKISPAFAGNLTQRQLERQGQPDARRFDAASFDLSRIAEEERDHG